MARRLEGSAQGRIGPARWRFHLFQAKLDSPRAPVHPHGTLSALFSALPNHSPPFNGRHRSSPDDVAPHVTGRASPRAWPSQEPGRSETFPGRPAYSEVLRALDGAGCTWETYEPLTCDDQCAIRVPVSGAILVFDTENVPEPLLCSVSVAVDRPHGCGSHSR